MGKLTSVVSELAQVFGSQVHVLEALVTELARSLGLPRIYLSANSGARIGLAEEIMSLFDIAWNDPAKPEKGFKYMFRGF
jgi:acetyl-CoA carboxylase/biotin carboxylase 1